MTCRLFILHTLFHFLGFRTSKRVSSVISRSELDPFLYIWYHTVRTQNGLSPCALTYCYGLVHVSVVFWHCVLTSSQEPPGQLWPNLVCSICRVRRQKSINFIAPTPRRSNLGVKKSVKLMYFLKIFFSTPRHRTDKLSM